MCLPPVEIPLLPSADKRFMPFLLDFCIFFDIKNINVAGITDVNISKHFEVSMNLFPCFWHQPLPRGLKPVKFLAAPHFPTKAARTSRPGPETVKAPTDINKPKKEFANNDLEPAKNFMPLEELCLNEAPFDTTEIDRLLDEIYNPAPDSKKRKIFKMVDTINHKLAENINSLQGNTTVNGDNVSKEDLLELLQAFLNYSKSVENYLKETKPSLP